MIDKDATHGLFKITFINQIGEHDTLWINVTDFENLGWYYDLYIDNKKIGICKQCDKLFKITGKSQKYCKECADNMPHNNYIPIENKTLICMDCRKEFNVDSMVNHKSRCDNCQHEYDKERKRNWKNNTK